MVIYNGDSTASTPFGTFSGVCAIPGFVTGNLRQWVGMSNYSVGVTDGAGTTTGWAADISCFTPCQTIVSQLDSSTPAANGDGYIRVCPNEDITLTGSGS